MRSLYTIINEEFSPEPVDMTFGELKSRVAELCGPMDWDVPEGIDLIETERGIETRYGVLVGVRK